MSLRKSSSTNLIRLYREQCGLTQEELAQQVNIGRNTVYRYEQHGAAGEDNLLRLATFFVDQGVINTAAALRDFWHDAAQRGTSTPPELQRLAESLATLSPPRMPIGRVPELDVLPPHSLMPFTALPSFVGREADLRALAAALRGRGATTVISGMAGRGKTRLAAEFVYRYGRYFPGGVYWMSFADARSIAANVAVCGAAPCLNLHPSFDALPLEQQVALVQTAWEQETSRLLVFDNCEDPALLDRWRPARGGCRILVTSRRAHWNRAHIAYMLPLAVLPRADGIALLRSYDETLNPTEADALAAELGDLPLALNVAGSYLARYAPVLSAVSYLEQLRVLTITHSSFAHSTPNDYDRDVARTLTLSYERLDTDNPTDALAHALLHRAAYLAPGEPIPRTLLLATLALPSNDERLLRRAEDALVRLVNDLGLLERAAQDTLRMHRLINGFARTVARDANAQAAVEDTFVTLEQQQSDAHAVFSPLVVQHLQFVVDVALRRADAHAVALANILGWSLTKASRYQPAHSYTEQALLISTQVLGSDHAQTAEAASVLGIIGLHTRRYLEAKPLLEQALATRKQAFGLMHAKIAWDLNNLGALLMFMGHLEEAQQLFEQELAIEQRVTGVSSPGAARSLSWLGYNALRRGGFAQAEQYFRQALSIQEQCLPADHAATALSLANVGDAHFCQGDFGTAETYVTRSLHMRQRLFGMHHVSSCESITLLGHIFRCRGDLVRGRTLLEESLPAIEIITLEPKYDLLIELAALTIIAEVQNDAAAVHSYTTRCDALIQHACTHADLNAAILLENQARLWTARGDRQLAQCLFGWARIIRA